MSTTRGLHRAPPAWRGSARVGGRVGLAVAVLLAVGPESPVAAPGDAGPPIDPLATAVVHGRPGSFGSLAEELPSGQPLAVRPVPGWGLPAGVQAGVTAVAGDGTVFVAGRDQHGGSGPATSPASVIGVYGGDGFRTIRLSTTTGDQEVVDRAGRPLAPSVADLAPVAAGEAMAFTVGRSYRGHDIAADGGWPVLGVLAKVDGSWQVAAQWSGGELRAVAAPGNQRACPELRRAAGHSDCRGLGELVSLPGSGDLIVAQSDAVMAVRLAGPDRAGRFTATVTGHYAYPAVRDPRTGEELDLTVRFVHADPTGEPGDERFVVGLLDRADEELLRPQAIQEFRYDVETGEIAPVSAPVIPGDQVADGGRFFGYTAAAYDRAGNLWAARHQWLAGGALAVYRKTAGGRRLGGADCPFDPSTPMSRYLSTGEGAAGGTGQTVWGQTCRPDVDLLQAKELLATVGLVPDPAGGMVAITLGGAVLPVRVSDRDGIEFRVGNVVDPAPRLLPTTDGSVLWPQPGAIDAHGHLWLAMAQAQPGDPAAMADQWLYEVDLEELFAPPPVTLPDVPGHIATVSAGHTVTTRTVPAPGAWAAVDVNSQAYVRPCGEINPNVDCGYDGVPGNGFVLSDRSGFGHLGGEVAYQVEAPVAGRYRVAYRVSTFSVTTEAEVTLSADGHTYTTPVATGGPWRTIHQAELVTLPAGVSTIVLSAAESRGGWYLSWFSLQRA